MNALQQPSPPDLRTALSDHQRLPNSNRLCHSVRQRRLHRRKATAWARAAPSGELQAAAAAVHQADVDRLSSPQDASASTNGSNGTHADAGSSSNGAHAPELCSPEDLVLEPGELSHIDRSRPLDAADVFRCSGCLLEACQVCSSSKYQKMEHNSSTVTALYSLCLTIVCCSTGTIRMCKDALEGSAWRLLEGDPHSKGV